MPALAIVCSATTALALALFVSRRRQRRKSQAHLLALREALALRQAFRHKLGVDIGGTLTKIVLAGENEADGRRDPLENVRLTRSHVHHELAFNAGSARLAFVSTPTATLEATARALAETLAYPATEARREVVASGGGAHRFREVFREILQVEMLPLKELQAVVEGLLFLAADGAAGELFTVDEETGAEHGVAWPAPFFPLVLVNMGSGVSVVRIDSATQHRRVNGTACGGATFLGLGRALTGEHGFQELLALAARGDESRVDKTVGDIYGAAGCEDLDMPPTFTAASFGKMAVTGAFGSSHGAPPPPPPPPPAAPSKEDLVRSLLRMVVQASVVLAKAYASQAGCLPRVVFVGGFLQDNALARRMIARSMARVGGRALFCRHSEFLGALGSIAACIHRHRQRQQQQGGGGASGGPGGGGSGEAEPASPMSPSPSRWQAVARRLSREAEGAARRTGWQLNWLQLDRDE
eukprot:Transcript_21741.p2 GENE.Transcript_21741~~Transcript_21741.p2  ORF type:complete len:478 (-),score=198.35 Transcript_21741:39-1442(-)